MAKFKVVKAYVQYYWQWRFVALLMAMLNSDSIKGMEYFEYLSVCDLQSYCGLWSVHKTYYNIYKEWALFPDTLQLILFTRERKRRDFHSAF